MNAEHTETHLHASLPLSYDIVSMFEASQRFYGVLLYNFILLQ